MRNIFSKFLLSSFTSAACTAAALYFCLYCTAAAVTVAAAAACLVTLKFFQCKRQIVLKFR